MKRFIGPNPFPLLTYLCFVVNHIESGCRGLVATPVLPTATYSFCGGYMPRLNFTARTIEALKAPALTREEYWDESTPGFGIRISPEGRKSWVFLYRFAGRARR